jgi:hypothetical protein
MRSDCGTVKGADVPWLAPLLLLLLSAPLLMFAAHAAAFRLLDRTGRRPTAHSSALVALIAVLVPVCAMAWQLGVSPCGFGYLAIVYAALSVLYIDVVNIAETSLHMHLLLELAWSGPAPLADLLDRYSADRMVAARLERLASIGQVRIEDGRCSIANRSTLYLAGVIDVWRVVLGLPTAPPFRIQNSGPEGTAAPQGPGSHVKAGSARIQNSER